MAGAAALAVVAYSVSSSAALLGEAADFVVLGLEGGKVTINSATSIVGNVGYADGVTSTTNQKVDLFDGAAFIHSGATVSFTAATFAPTGGIQTGAAVDAKLDQAHLDAINASAGFAALTPDIVLGALGDNDNRTVNSVGAQTVISLASLNYKEDTLQLVGSSTDVFIFNVAGAFDFSASVINLVGANADNVIFNFLNASDINVNKAETVFNGTILAPLGVVDYHNPATLNGRIIAPDITLHSDFNIARTFLVQISEPSTLNLLLVGFLGLLGLNRLRSRTPAV